MPYSKTIWVDNTTPAITAANLNNIELGVEAAINELDTNVAKLTGASFSGAVTFGDTTAFSGTATFSGPVVGNSSVSFLQTPTVSGSTVWHAGNDGATSGLDADLLDGVQGSNYARLDVLSNFSVAPQVLSSTVWHAGNDGAGSGLDADLLDGVQGSSFARLDTTSNFTTAPTIASNQVWHAGNDGAGSGLDADLLDGLHGSSFGQLTATNSWSGSNSFSSTVTVSAFKALELTHDNAELHFDGSPAKKRITNNDGSGNWNFRAGNYFNGGEKYVLAGDGAAKIELSSDVTPGAVKLKVAPTGVNADDPVAWTHELVLNTTTGLTLDNDTVFYEGSALTGGSTSIGVGGSHVPTKGLYVFGAQTADVRLEIFQGGAWRSGSSFDTGGAVFSDGSNVRFTNFDTVSATLRWLKVT